MSRVRTAQDERFILEMAGRIADGATHGVTADAVLQQIGNEVALFDAVLQDTAFRTAAQQVLQSKCSAVPPAFSAQILEPIFAQRLAAQAQLKSFLADPSVIAEAKQRAQQNALAPTVPIIANDCTLLLPEEPQQLVDKLRPQVNAQGPLILLGEKALQDALALTFNGGGDQPLLAPLKDAMSRSGLPTGGRTVDDLAESFLSSRTKEAMDRAHLVETGWVQQQLAQQPQNWVQRAQQNPPAPTGHTVP